MSNGIERIPIIQQISADMPAMGILDFRNWYQHYDNDISELLLPVDEPRKAITDCIDVHRMTETEDCTRLVFHNPVHVKRVLSPGEKGRICPGAYSNVACCSPAAAQRWTDQMATDTPAAPEIEPRRQRFTAEYNTPFITERRHRNAAANRFLTVVGGRTDVGLPMRFSYRRIPDTKLSRVRAAASKIIPEFV